jgi:hypothetical protein
MSQAPTVPLDSTPEGLPASPASSLHHGVGTADPPTTTPLTLSSAKNKLLELLKWAFSFPAMLGVCLIGRVFFQSRNFFVDPDLWWHIRVGQDILRTGHFPTNDTYSWTVAGQPWLAYEWLGEVVLALVNRVGGVVALSAVLTILGSAILLALYWLASTRAENSKAGFVSALTLAVFASVSFTLRPQMLGYLFLILTLVVLEYFRRGRSAAIWFLPPIFLLWVNSHGSWVIGLGVVSVYLFAGFFNFHSGAIYSEKWTSHQRIRIEAALLGSLCTVALTPYATQTAAYPFEVASKLPLGVANVGEWRPMPFDAATGKMFLVLLLGLVLLQALFNFRWRLDEFLLCLFGILMACLHVRFLLLFVPFSAPILATFLARWVPPYRRQADIYFLNAILMIAAVAGMAWFLPTREELENHVAEQFPVGTTYYLAGHQGAERLFNEYGFGGYLIGAGEKVFVDGRSDPFERGGVLADYLHITRIQPGALKILDFYGVNKCLLEKNEPLANILATASGWKLAAEDKVSVLYVREAKP